LKKYLLSLAGFIQSWGLFAGFGVAFIDGMGLPLPGVVDAVVISYSLAHPSLAWAAVLLTSIGSTLGCLVLYGIGFKGGQAFVEKKMPPAQFHRIHGFFERYRLLALTVPAMMPPPFPFKAFILMAALFEVRLWHFIVTVFIGRVIRFAVFTFLVMRYGADIAYALSHNIRLVLLVAAAVFAIILIIRYARNRAAARA